MRKIFLIRHAFPSLMFSLAMSAVTTVHHLHSALVLHPNGPGMHVVWNEALLVPIILVSMFVFVNTGSRIALWIYVLIAFAGFVCLGLYEGGWNHTANVIAHLRISSPDLPLSTLLPAGDFHTWFYELSGVATFVCAMLASAYTYQFAREEYENAHS